MLRGLYTATTAMKTNNKKLDVITNNIANANTIGYKRDLLLTESFPEVFIKKKLDMTDEMRNNTSSNIGITQDDNKYILNTNKGFFKTKTGNDVNSGQTLKVTVNENGYLSTYDKDQNGKINTADGNIVIGRKGPVFVGDKNFTIDNKGQVMVDGNVIDSLVTPKPLGTIGTLNSGVRVDKIRVNYSQGTFQQTDNPLDLAIKGDGFFVVETPNGNRYTRDGRFTMNPDREWITTEGYKLVGTDGPIVTDGKETSISSTGEVIVDGEFINQVKIMNLENIKDLRKAGSNLYEMEKNTEIKEKEFTGQVMQGYIEGSNVNSMKEMTAMITLFRNYESNQKVVKAYDDTLGKAVNDVGRV